MIRLLSRLFIKNYKDYHTPAVRTGYGMLCGTVGILLNLCLFAGKYIAGFLSSSISITADAFNNLSDAFSSIVTLAGFKLSAQKPDPDHPFGHGRLEYISGLIVALAIILVGFELIQASVEKILHPKALEFSMTAILILILSILIKLYMAYYNHSIAGKIGSETLDAVSKDSLNDTFSTLFVLIATILSHFTNLKIDGYCGVLVGLFICFSGYQAARDTVSPLLGKAPDPEFVTQIKKIVLSHDRISGLHDLVVHNYGPGKILITLHAEVPADLDLVTAHDLVDEIERELKEKLACNAVIHMDPLFADDEESKALKNKILAHLHTLDERFSLHDFRMIRSGEKTKVCFDISAPFDYKGNDEELALDIQKRLTEENPRYIGIIEIDRTE